MKLISRDRVPTTTVHQTLERQQFIKPGEVQTAVQTVNYAELAPGESFPAHQHPDCEEFFFVIEGLIEVTVAGGSFRFKAGDLLVIEPGEMHEFVNNSPKTATFFQFRVLLSVLTD